MHKFIVAEFYMCWVVVALCMGLLFLRNRCICRVVCWSCCSCICEVVWAVVGKIYMYVWGFL